MFLMSDEDNFWLIGMGVPKRDDRPLKGMTDPKKDDRSQKGWPTPKRDDQPQKGLPTPKGMTNPWADKSANPRSWRLVPLGFPWGLRGAHSRILIWKLLAHCNQRPYHAIISLIYGKVISSILGPFSLQGNSPISRDSGQLSTTI